MGRLGIRLETRPTKPPDPTSIYQVSLYQFQSLNMSLLNSLLIAPHCPLKSCAYCLNIMVEEPMKKINVLLTNATGIMPEEFNKDYNKRRGYSLYPPLSLTTVAASIFKKVDDIEVEVLDMNFETIKYFNENDKSDLSTYDFMKNKIVDKMDEFQPDLVPNTIIEQNMTAGMRVSFPASINLLISTDKQDK